MRREENSQLKVSHLISCQHSGETDRRQNREEIKGPLRDKTSVGENSL
jgi:ribosomal protein L32